MGHSQRPRAPGEGNINISTVKGQIVAIGSGAKIQITGGAVSQAGDSTIDLPALQSSLMKLYEDLGSAGLPMKQQMLLQAATHRAVEVTDSDEPKAEALAEQIKQLGETFQSAGQSIEHGSQVGQSILKVAGIVGPLVVGGARVVASWFGLSLP